MADDWPFISYNPLEYPPLPQPEPPRPSLRHRLAAFGVRWISQTASYVCAAWGLYILATGPI